MADNVAVADGATDLSGGPPNWVLNSPSDGGNLASRGVCERACPLLAAETIRELAGAERGAVVSAAGSGALADSTGDTSPTAAVGTSEAIAVGVAIDAATGSLLTVTFLGARLRTALNNPADATITAPASPAAT